MNRSAGIGGEPSLEALALLSNRNVAIAETGADDLRAGRIDPRIVAVLTRLSADHQITVSSMCADHSKFTAGGSISNHHYGRGVDIAAVDGVPVNASNSDARAIAMELQELDAAIRPDEIGTPWAIAGLGYFTDSGNQHHLHIGFKQQITPGSNAPGRNGNTLAISAVAPPGGDPLPSSAAAVEKPPVPSARAGGAGSKARAAVEEARKHLGTAYLGGGSTPETNFDCSGLMQWCYAQTGIQIPRVARDQIAARNGAPVGRDDLLPGDLVFFRDAGGHVHHVGVSLGGDRFIHAPHTGDVVKISSLDEPAYAEQFTSGRRFDAAGSAPPEPTEVAKAHAAVARDAADVRRRDSQLFAAVKAQEAAKAQSQPSDGLPAPVARPGGYPGDDAPKEAVDEWLAGEAERAGLPPELPAMAGLVDAGQKAEWFIDTALAVKKKRIAAGDVDFGKDPEQWDEWIALSLRPRSA